MMLFSEQNLFASNFPGAALRPIGPPLNAMECGPIKGDACRPTVSLGVTSAVVSSCGHESGQIEQRVAHKLAGHWATDEGPAERTQHRHQQHAQPVAHVRQRQDRRPQLTPRGFTNDAPPSDSGQPCGRTREERRRHRCIVPRDARSTRRSSFRLLIMASPH